MVESKIVWCWSILVILPWNYRLWIANQIPEFLDIRIKTKQLHSDGFTDFIPFLSIIGNGDEIFCFDKDNQVVLLDFITEKTTPIEGTFSDCLMKQLEELEERKNMKIRGEDKTNRFWLVKNLQLRNRIVP